MASAREVAKALRDDLLRYTAFVQESLDAKTADRIGKAVTAAVLDLVAKGISPIEGAGRFPAYKWAALRNQLRKAVGKQLGAHAKKQFVVRRRMNQRQLLAHTKEENRKAKLSDAHEFGGRYPFTEEALQAGKKPRPVNLKLHGDFLKALRAEVTGTAGDYGIEIGFFPGSRDRKGVEAYLKEQGHREGANGQPERPIIPVGTEDFAQTVQEVIWGIIEEAMDEAAKK